jgi:predicted O-methyltransferase YrrM
MVWQKGRKMAESKWVEVDSYFESLFIPKDEGLEAALDSSARAESPAQQVPTSLGKLLAILAQSIGAKSILEIGTLCGYSTIWLGRTLPQDGKLFTLEIDDERARLARLNVERAGLGKVVEIRTGPALEMLPRLAMEGHAPFDLVFIDADKPNYRAYLSWAMKLTRRGSLIVADNIVRNGAVADAGSRDEKVRGVQAFNAAVAEERRLSAVGIQTVGSKGYDGFLIALVIGEK